MDNAYVKTIYDRLCMALTEYESHAEDGDVEEYHDGEALYGKIVDITNYMSEHM